MVDCKLNFQRCKFIRGNFVLTKRQKFSLIRKQQLRFSFRAFQPTLNSYSEATQEPEKIEIRKSNKQFLKEEISQQAQQSEFQLPPQFFQQNEEVDFQQQNPQFFQQQEIPQQTDIKDQQQQYYQQQQDKQQDQQQQQYYQQQQEVLDPSQQEYHFQEQQENQFFDPEFVEQENRNRRILTSKLRNSKNPKLLQLTIDENRHLLNTTHISAACACIAHMLQRNPPFPFQSIFFTLNQLIEFIDANIDQLDGAELSTCVWMMGKMNNIQKRKILNFQNILGRAFERAFELETSLNAEDVTRLIWSAAKLKCVKKKQINQILILAQKIQPKYFQGSSATTILWSMATLKIFNQELFDHFAQIAGGNIRGVTCQGLANGLWAMKKLRYRHQNFLDQAEKIIQRGFFDFSWKQIAMIYSAFSELGVKNESTLEILSKQFIQVMEVPRVPKFSDWNSIPNSQNFVNDFGENFNENQQELNGISTQKNQQSEQNSTQKFEKQINFDESNQIAEKQNIISQSTQGKQQNTLNNLSENQTKLDQNQQQKTDQNLRWYRSDETAYYSEFSRIENGLTSRKIPKIEFEPVCMILFSMSIQKQSIDQANLIAENFFHSKIPLHTMLRNQMCLLRRAQLQFRSNNQQLNLPIQLQQTITHIYKKSNKIIESYLLDSIFSFVQQNFQQAQKFYEILVGEFYIDIAIIQGDKKIAVQAGLEGFYMRTNNNNNNNNNNNSTDKNNSSSNNNNSNTKSFKLLGGVKAYYELLQWQGWTVVQVPYYKWDNLQYKECLLETIKKYLQS